MTKHNPFNLQTLDLPPYASVEQMFPEWLSARWDLQALVPDQLTYRIIRGRDSSRTLVIDYEWLAEAYSQAPSASDKGAIDLRSRLIGAAINSINKIPIGLAGYTEGEAAAALEAVNQELVADEEERRKMGMPTRRDIIEHILGLEPARGTVAFKIEQRRRS
jgi:hypothetical protein